VHLVAVIIPIHKSRPTAGEVKSLVQCLQVLSGHSIYLLSPRSLDTSHYTELARSHRCPRAGQARFDDAFFASVAGYNTLLRSADFYRRFERYQYMLIHQLDAYVFRDELDHWCKKDYHYIGAPWFKGFQESESKSFFGVGNGGFSLRNTSAALRVLRELSAGHPPRRRTTFRFRNLLRSSPAKPTPFNPDYEDLHEFIGNEDLFWGEVCRRHFPWYRVPTPEVASQFSFEVNPAFLYEKNDGQLPTGCHGWERYDPGFWRKHIH